MKYTISILLTWILALAIWGSAKAEQTDLPDPYGGIILKFNNLSERELLDTANFYLSQNRTDTALICFNILVNKKLHESDTNLLKIQIEACNQSAAIFYYMADYRTAYERMIKALILCEKANFPEMEARIYTNIGAIYYRFKKYDLADSYYRKALILLPLDSRQRIITLNNLGANELEIRQLDSAHAYAEEALQISLRYNRYRAQIVQNTLATIFQKNRAYDSAYAYFLLSLQGAETHGETELIAENLSNLGDMFLEIKQIDSSVFYTERSNKIATEHNLLRIQAKNHLILSKIQNLKGNYKRALQLYERYAALVDSASNTEKFGEINQLQRLYEVSKTDEQIQNLVVEQQIKERTIYYRAVIQLITLAVLIVVIMILIFVFIQNRKLNTAYHVLFDKNIKIVEYQEDTSAKNPEKYRKNILAIDQQNELLSKILTVMKDPAVICDPEFTVDKLAELVQSNSTYISTVINNILNKNFRTFLNEYRIKEAQQLFSKSDAEKYTIEAISLQVGFKSRTTFRTVFKEVTGLTPNFYVKSIKERQKM